jgi:hypothetical protein
MRVVLIQTESILCSYPAERSDAERLWTALTVYPKMVHQETLRHRIIYIVDALAADPDFSFSVSSSRAIPTLKLIEEARSPNRAAPVFWGSEKRGMVPGPEHNELIPNTHWRRWYDKDFLTREELWEIQARQNADIAEAYYLAGYHKSIGNRVLDASIHTHVLMSGGALGWRNFFGLRLDRAADPILRALAESLWRNWNETPSQPLNPGQWHLPFIDAEDGYDLTQPWQITDDPLRVSTARCARLSFRSFETTRRATLVENLDLYQRLVGSLPLHASPAEHQATPDMRWHGHVERPGFSGYGEGWLYAHQAGNLGAGWRQHRKMIPQEAVAAALRTGR